MYKCLQFEATPSKTRMLRFFREQSPAGITGARQFCARTSAERFFVRATVVSVNSPEKKLCDASSVCSFGSENTESNLPLNLLPVIASDSS